MTDHQCMYEERFSQLEKDYAELNARMDSKKEDIYSINKELVHDREKQIELIEKVTEVTVLLKENQKSRKENNEDIEKKFDELEKKFDKVSKELAETKEQLTDFVASQRSFRSTMVIGIPIAISFIVGIIFHVFNI